MSSLESNEFPRIVSFDAFGVQPTAAEAFPDIPVSAEFCKAFEDATGWTLGFDESSQSLKRREQPGLSHSPITGTLYINDMSAALPPGINAAHRGKCDALASQINGLLNDLQSSKLKLYAAQAELACQIPVIPSPEESYRLAELLASLLNSVSEGLGCTKAAFYQVCDDHEWLMMRASTGLDGKQIASDRRLLSSAKADLEAMSGYAVVADKPSEVEVWAVPESCQGAACVPVSSMTAIIGTLWVFSDQPRDFSDEEINLMEIVAGRMATELERQVLIQENLRLREANVKSPARVECHPVVDPPFPGWKLEGECGVYSDKFVEWDVSDQEEIRLTIGTGTSQSERVSASIFVDPLTTEFQVHGRVQDVAFWLWDRETGVVFDIDEWAKPLFLESSQWLVATTIDDPIEAQSLLESFEKGESYDDLVLCLHRV